MLAKRLITLLKYEQFVNAYKFLRIMMHQGFLMEISIEIVWLVILLALILYFLLKLKFLLNAKKWLITSGKITRMEWTTYKNTLWPEIEYTYTVYEKDFIGEYFFIDTVFNSPSSRYARLLAYKTALAYQQDQLIDIFYNPEDPRQSALDVLIPSKLKVIILFLGLFILFQSVIIVRSLLG